MGAGARRRVRPVCGRGRAVWRRCPIPLSTRPACPARATTRVAPTARCDGQGTQRRRGRARPVPLSARPACPARATTRVAPTARCDGQGTQRRRGRARPVPARPSGAYRECSAFSWQTTETAGNSARATTSRPSGRAVAPTADRATRRVGGLFGSQRPRIELKNCSLVLVSLSLSTMNSIAAMSSMSCRSLRRIQTR